MERYTIGREEWIAQKRKNYNDYSDKIVISDASPLIYLNGINKLYYLKLLFNDIYTTDEVRKECRKGKNGFDLPDWIKIDNPKTCIINFIKDKNIDPGERSAIALALEIDASRRYNIGENRPCLILDDHEAGKTYDKYKTGINRLDFKDILTFAFDKKLFTREESIKMFETLNEKGKTFKKNDIMIIFNDTTANNKRRNKS